MINTYEGNLPSDIRDDMIREAFESFGVKS